MARKKAWGPSNPLWRYLHGRKKHSRPRARARTVTRVKTMARYRYRRRGRSRGGFGLGRVLSVKNLALTAAGAFLLPRFVNVDPKLGAAAGGFMGAGPIGAIAGYLGAPLLSGILGGSSSGGSMNW